MTAVIIFYLIDPLLVKFKSEFKFEIPAIILAIFKPVLLLAGTVAFKIVIGKILNIRDDVSIVEASHCFLKILFFSDSLSMLKKHFYGFSLFSIFIGTYRGHITLKVYQLP